jgi:phage N-6-adenine-methyltransferase
MSKQYAPAARAPSIGDEYMTPRWVWQPWHEALRFVLDAAATDLNHLPVCRRWYCSGQAFYRDWAQDVLDAGGGAVWCNPPYSRAGGPLKKWVAKAKEESAKGLIVCMLLPADVSTDWFSMLWDRIDGCWLPGVRGYFADTRIRFIDPRTGQKSKGTPTFGSLIVVLDCQVIYGSNISNACRETS